jgi:UrcA family protein
MSLRSGMLLCSMMALAASITSGTAYADTQGSQDVIAHATTVRFADLNLNRSQDVAELYSRIEIAVDQVCGPRTLTGFYTTAPGYERCYRDAMAQAIGRVDRPALTALYREQMSRPEGRQLSIAEQ